MSNMWNVVFTKLIAINTVDKTELQRLVNLEGDTNQISDQIIVKLKESVISDMLITKWRELKPNEEEIVNE